MGRIRRIICIYCVINIFFSGMSFLSIITINPYIEPRFYAVESSPFPMQANTWKNMSPGLSPSARSHHGHQMVCDSESARTVLFGGRDYWNGSQNDTWAYNYDNNSWTNMQPMGHPSRRSSSAIVYDSESDRIILFGGWREKEGPFSDTWSYDYNNNTWTNLTPRISPPALVDHSMSYDSDSDRIILFGGVNETSDTVDDTWSYDYNNNTWTDMKPIKSPPARWGHAMTYDAESDRVILFSGITINQPSLNDLWAYDFNSNTWTDITPSIRPHSRMNAGITYDSQMDRVVLFGGSYYFSTFHDTWTYDYNNNEWTNMSPLDSPSPRWDSSMSYDMDSGRIILFGGSTTSNGTTPGKKYNDTWIYELIDGNIPPFIVSTTPQNGSTNVEENTKIVIQWSEPMNRISANAAFSASPSISCSWSWNGVYQSCEPLQSLLSHTNYTVRISTAATDLSGKHMLANYTFMFTTDSGGSPISIINISVYLASIIVAILIVGVVFMLMRRKKKKKENG